MAAPGRARTMSEPKPPSIPLPEAVEEAITALLAQGRPDLVESLRHTTAGLQQTVVLQREKLARPSRLPLDVPREDVTTTGVTVGYGKWFAKLKGQSTVWIVIVGLVLFVVWRESDRLDRGTAQRTAEAVTVMKTEHAAILTTQQELILQARIANWLNTLPPDERPRMLPPPGVAEQLERLPARSGRR